MTGTLSKRCDRRTDRQMEISVLKSRVETIHRHIADTKATVRTAIHSEDDTIRYGSDVTNAKVRNEHEIPQKTIIIFQ